ncbi:hypothetical protein EJ02DRAFT_95390 [Clathrospora elynae]|uniref:Uncharacterized protein n=1 Tax=Clathrospora elynae TaxID=706981 RepID=A0A6A5SXJ6_9PLEO|nr:hypothetical protein EJ02DRAFT_95390 [Clathrospora elynae]
MVVSGCTRKLPRILPSAALLTDEGHNSSSCLITVECCKLGAGSRKLLLCCGFHCLFNKRWELHAHGIYSCVVCYVVVHLRSGKFDELLLHYLTTNRFNTVKFWRFLTAGIFGIFGHHLFSHLGLSDFANTGRTISRLFSLASRTRDRRPPPSVC